MAWRFASSCPLPMIDIMIATIVQMVPVNDSRISMTSATHAELSLIKNNLGISNLKAK